MKLLYVCDYNLERSPAAEIITREKSKQAGLEITVNSAGLNKCASCCMKSEMTLALSQLKLSTPRHIPKTATPELIHTHDIILCFEKRQKDRLLEMSPEKKIYTLSEYVSWLPRNIKDSGHYIITPKPGSELKEHITAAYFWLTNTTDSRVYEFVLDRYVKTARTIEKHVDLLIKKLLKQQTRQLQQAPQPDKPSCSTSTH